MSEDRQLLHRYAAEGSETAFADLVRRHVDLVYSAALRMLNGDAHRAQDVSQQVFSELASQAKSLSRHPALTGWLYTTTRRMAWRTIRSERRRASREQAAHTMNELTRESAGEPTWDNLRPVIDDAMHELNETDRAAVLLRLFKNKSLREVGAELGLTENAARMRVERALDKLRRCLARKGVNSAASALAVALSANAITSTPVGFTAGLAGASLAAANAQSTSIPTILKLMASAKLKLGLAAVLVAGVAATFMAEHQALLNARNENDSLRREIAQLKADNDAFSYRLNRRAQAALNFRASGPTPQKVTSETNNLRGRLIANPIKVTAAQLAQYVDASHHSAASLLAAFRVSHDPKFLAEAMEKYPNDPHVDFEAVLGTNSPATDRRQWLTAFENSAPDNALPNYLSALDYFKSGQTDQGIQEMAAATAKKGFQDYSMDRMLDDQEAYLAAGSSPTEAEISAATQLLLPQLLQIKNLGQDLVELSKTYQQAGDATSAQATLQMAVQLGQRYANTAPAETEISQLVGMAVERMALGTMDPQTPYGDNGQTVQDQINQLTQQRTTINDLNQQAGPLLETMSDGDYLTYKERWMAFGEESALRWVIGRYGQQ
jgi:RNA polymerase sigma factor (sigma-70 family)